MTKNYRNSYFKKTAKTQLGELEVNIPRDRNGNYTPQIIPKYSRSANGMEEKILALYACGMSQRDISEHIGLNINKKKVYRLCKELAILKPQRLIKPKHPRKLARNRRIEKPNQL